MLDDLTMNTSRAELAADRFKEFMQKIGPGVHTEDRPGSGRRADEDHGERRDRSSQMGLGT